MSASKRRWLVNLIIWGGGALAGLAVGLMAVTIARSTDEPVVVSGLREADGVVVRGGVLQLVADVQRTRYCPAETQRYLWRDTEHEGRPIRQFLPLASTTSPIIAPSGLRMLLVPVPEFVAEGEWYYQSVTAEHCSWMPGWLSPTRLVRSPDERVRVVP